MPKYLVNLDLNQNQLVKARVENLSSAPGSPVAGQIYFNTTSNTLQYYSGSGWVVIADGDVTAVIGGTGLTNASGNSTSGAITLNVADLTVAEIAADSILIAGETFADNDTSLMTAAAINDRIESFGYTTNAGDITEVVAGTGLADGGTNGSVTLNVSGVTVSELAANSLTTSGESFADNDTTLMTSAAINDRIESFGYTTNTGDITAVVAGTGLSGGDTSGSATQNLADTAVSAGSYGSATQVRNYTVDAQGRLTAAANTSIAIASSAVTDFTEATQDVVGAFVSGTSNEVNVAYDDGAGTLTIGLPDDVTITGNLTVNGTTTTVNSTTVTVDDKNLELGSVASPSDSTADGGGITLKGDSDHTILWTNSTDSWDFSEHLNIASGKEFQINGTQVLNATQLGSGVINSSLVTVGTITSGTWTATDIGVSHGGTGASTASAARANLGVMEKVTATIGDGSATSYAITHNRSTTDVMVQVYDASSNDTVFANVTRNSTSQVTVSFASAPSTNAYKVVVIG